MIFWTLLGVANGYAHAKSAPERIGDDAEPAFSPVLESSSAGFKTLTTDQIDPD